MVNKMENQLLLVFLWLEVL